MDQQMNEWSQESAAIIESGQCRCTEDETCWEHEALETGAAYEVAGFIPADR